MIYQLTVVVKYFDDFIEHFSYSLYNKYLVVLLLIGNNPLIVEEDNWFNVNILVWRAC